MEDREERVKMRREFEDRRNETGAKKESKEEWAGRKMGICEGLSRGDGSGQAFPGWRTPAAPGRRCWMGVCSQARTPT